MAAKNADMIKILDALREEKKDTEKGKVAAWGIFLSIFSIAVSGFVGYGKMQQRMDGFETSQEKLQEQLTSYIEKTDSRNERFADKVNSTELKVSTMQVRLEAMQAAIGRINEGVVSLLESEEKQ